jgi:hypothetical protein
MLALGIVLALAPVLLGAQHDHGPSSSRTCVGLAEHGCTPSGSQGLVAGAEAAAESYGHVCLACFLLRSAQAQGIATGPAAAPALVGGALSSPSPPAVRGARPDTPWARGPPLIS